MIERRPRAPVLRSIAFAGNGGERLLGKAQIDALRLEQPLVSLDHRSIALDFNVFFWPPRVLHWKIVEPRQSHPAARRWPVCCWP